MSREKSQYTITTRVWTSAEDLLVPIGNYRRRGRNLVYDPHGRSSFELQPLTHELVIHDFRLLNVGDPSAVTEFLNEHGMVDAHDEHDTDWFTYPARLRLDELQYRLGTIKRLADSYIAWSNGESLIGLWQDVVVLADDDEYYALVVDDELDALQSFQRFFNDELARAHAHPQIEQFLRTHPKTRQLPTERDLLDALVLQLFELVDSKIPVRACANETCPWGVFVRQADTAQEGQYRTKGVKYCCQSCGKAQRQRNYRRRKREEQLGR